MPRAPPDTTSPATGARMNRRNSDASAATITVTTARATALGRRGGGASTRLMPLADDNWLVEHVDVRSPQFRDDFGRRDVLVEGLGRGGMGRGLRNARAVENRLAFVREPGIP